MWRSQDPASLSPRHPVRRASRSRAGKACFTALTVLELPLTGITACAGPSFGITASTAEVPVIDPAEPVNSDFRREPGGGSGNC
jgi:hypothetical protein